jgi:hypothetical protein
MFLFSVLLIATALLSALAGRQTPTKVSASVKDTSVEGLDGLNINIEAPFQVNNVLCGFKYALGGGRVAPDALFAKRSFETGLEGKLSVDADYNLIDRTVGVVSKWTSNALGLSVGAKGDSRNNLKQVELSKDVPLLNNQLSVNAVYDLLKKKVTSTASTNVGNTGFNVKYDSESKDPLLTVTQTLDADNEVIPSLALKSGEITYGYKRKWNGGSLLGRLSPGEKLSVEWKDNGSLGAWVTNAEIPLAEDGKTKVSFAREWNY